MRSSYTASSVFIGCCRSCRTARRFPRCFSSTADNVHRSVPPPRGREAERSPVSSTSLPRRRSLHCTSVDLDEISYWRPATLTNELVSAVDADLLNADTAWVPTKDFTFDDFLREAYVVGKPRNHVLLVDEPAQRKNFELWAGLLDFRLRVDGTTGALDIWKGIHQRKLDLPTVGQAADRIWGVFITIALKNKKFMMELWDYAQSLAERTQRRWEALYERILAFYLRQDNRFTSKAWVWHLRLNQVNLPGEGAIERLVEDSLHSKTGLRIFRRIYDDAGQRNIYDKMITSLCERHEYVLAEAWHSHMIGMGDYPSNATVVEPLREHFRLLGDEDKVHSITEAMTKTGVWASGTESSMKSKVQLTRESMSEMIGQTYGFKPKTISDTFASRLFATRTFTLQFIILGIAAFGTQSIGPLAMRELAARCTSAEDLKSKIEIMEKNNIKHLHGRYSTVLERVARDGREDIFQAIVSSDQHPDVYDDLKLQRKLLGQYTLQQDQVQIDRTLYILGLFDSQEDVGRWNRILYTHIAKNDRESTMATLEDMLNLGIPISDQVIQKSFKSFMPRRVVNRAPEVHNQTYDGISFVANMWLRILQSGGEVPATGWKQIIIGYGMLGRLKELEALTVWLASHYSKRPTTSASTIPVSAEDDTETLAQESRSNEERSASLNPGKYLAPGDERHPLNIIFPTSRKKSFVEWGFKSLGRPTPKRSRDLGYRFLYLSEPAACSQYLTMNSRKSRTHELAATTIDSSQDTFLALEDISALDLPSSSTATELDDTTLDSDVPFGLEIPPFVPTMNSPILHPHFKTRNPNNQYDHPQVPRFARGIALLRHLHTLGVPVRISSVRSASQHRLRQLFEDDSQMRSTKRVNRIARAQNDMTLPQVVRACNAVWGQTGGRQLFRVKEAVLQEMDAVEEAMARGQGRIKLKEGWDARRKAVWIECLGEAAAGRMEKVCRMGLQVESYRETRKVDRKHDVHATT